jgi:hypothetical protein
LTLAAVSSTLSKKMPLHILGNPSIIHVDVRSVSVVICMYKATSTRPSCLAEPGA